MSLKLDKQIHEGFKSWFTGKEDEKPDPGNPMLAVTKDPFSGKPKDAVEHFFPNAPKEYKEEFTIYLKLNKIIRNWKTPKEGKGFVRDFIEDMAIRINKSGYRFATIQYFIGDLKEKHEKEFDSFSNAERAAYNRLMQEKFPKLAGAVPEPANGEEAAGAAGAPGEEPSGGEGGAPEGEGGSGAEFAAPVFKKYSGKEQEAGAPQRSLASQLMKLFPDVEKSALTKILKDVAAQLKANNIEIQENKDIFVRNLIKELIEEGRLPGNARQLKKQAKILALQPGEYKKHPKLAGFYAMNDEGVTRRYDSEKEAQDWSGVISVDDSGADIEVDDADVIATYDEPGPKEPAANVKPGSAYAMLYKKFNEVIKTLDVAEPAGLEGAMKVDQSFLGVYKLYKAMKYTQKFLKNPETADSLDDNQADRIVKMLPIMKKMRPLNEEQWMYNIDHTNPKRDLLTLLRDFIGIFERYGVDNRERAIKAMRDARGVKDPKDPEYQPADLKSAAGQVNMRQSVGPKLKASGIDLKSPEGKALQKRMLKVIRRFLGKNLKRMGKDVKIISENAELQKIILNNLREILAVRGLAKK